MMFIWDFSAIFACLLIVALGIVFAFWLAYTLSRRPDFKEAGEEGYFRQCYYCGHVYMDYAQRDPCRCPRCLSYHDR